MKRQFHGMKPAGRMAIGERLSVTVGKGHGIGAHMSFERSESWVPRTVRPQTQIMSRPARRFHLPLWYLDQ